ncbi:MAG: hypothetical protein IJ133_04520 [Clostridia bacterium]|nr:hypothetical protein [Clostridia bacterium]
MKPIMKTTWFKVVAAVLVAALALGVGALLVHTIVANKRSRETEAEREAARQLPRVIRMEERWTDEDEAGNLSFDESRHYSYTYDFDNKSLTIRQTDGNVFGRLWDCFFPCFESGEDRLLGYLSEYVVMLGFGRSPLVCSGAIDHLVDFEESGDKSQYWFTVEDGRLLEMKMKDSSSNQDLTRLHYDRSGVLTGFQTHPTGSYAGDDSSVEITRDEQGRPKRLLIRSEDGTIQSITLTYGKDGRAESAVSNTSDGPTTYTFTYDESGRLLRIDSVYDSEVYKESVKRETVTFEYNVRGDLLRMKSVAVRSDPERGSAHRMISTNEIGYTYSG